MDMNIVKLLADAGGDGIHYDDITILLDFEKSNLSQRLQGLKKLGLVDDLQHERWRYVETVQVVSLTETRRTYQHQHNQHTILTN
jgi:DNA-binding IclR family transcriptional regulator